MIRHEFPGEGADTAPFSFFFCGIRARRLVVRFFCGFGATCFVLRFFRIDSARQPGGDTLDFAENRVLAARCRLLVFAMVNIRRALDNYTPVD
jgi:hypothetical protein